MSTRIWPPIVAAAVFTVWMGGAVPAQPEPTLAEPAFPPPAPQIGTTGSGGSASDAAPPAVPLPMLTADTPPTVPSGAAAQDPAADNPEGFAPLEQGPVHEAYAENFTIDAPEPYVVKREPPPAVEELPPDLKPDGAVWIPGYWMWADDQDDFVWVSGVWRVPPPGRQWVPGYWSQVDNGYQWTPGFWAEAETDELAYLPTPPATLETGPTYPAPANNYFWVPGCWIWNTTSVNYVWRPGYWNQGYSNWIWIPSRYQYTPYGCVRLTGYWDRPWARRGLLFAPIRFYRPLYLNPGFVYTPRFWVNLSFGYGNFFRTPNRGYFYGNYAAPRYLAAGYTPWYGLSHGRFYDPFQQHHSVLLHGTQPNWVQNYRHEFERISHGHNGPGVGTNINHGPGLPSHGTHGGFLNNVTSLHSGRNNFDSIRDVSLSHVQRHDLQSAVSQSVHHVGEIRQQRQAMESQLRTAGAGAGIHHGANALSGQRPQIQPNHGHPGQAGPLQNSLGNSHTPLSTGNHGRGLTQQGDLGRLHLPHSTALRGSSLPGLGQGAANHQLQGQQGNILHHGSPAGGGLNLNRGNHMLSTPSIHPQTQVHRTPGLASPGVMSQPHHQGNIGSFHPGGQSFHPGTQIHPGNAGTLHHGGIGGMPQGGVGGLHHSGGGIQHFGGGGIGHGGGMGHGGGHGHGH